VRLFVCFTGDADEPHCYFRGYAVYKFNDYIAHGTRQQYWEEPFTKAVMEGIQVFIGHRFDLILLFTDMRSAPVLHIIKVSSSLESFKLNSTALCVLISIEFIPIDSSGTTLHLSLWVHPDWMIRLAANLI
jgi:hypothetical protein